MARLLRFLAIPVCIALVAGCSTGMPQATGLKPTASTAASTMPTHTSPATRAPTASPSAASAATTAKPAFSWPVNASALFKPGAAPDDFACPLYLLPDDGMLFCATMDGGVFKAKWNGYTYVASPVAEGLSAGSGKSFFMDELGQIAFLPGTKLYSGNVTAPVIAMVNIVNGSRCNLGDYCGWKEEGLVVSDTFQYAGGRVLTRLSQIQNGKLQPTDKWAIFDIQRKDYYVLDMAGFAAKNLHGWQDVNSVGLILGSGYHLYAACAVGRYDGTAVAPQPTPSTGKSAAATPLPETGKKSTYECLFFSLDANGNAQAVGVTIASGETKNFCGLQNARLISAAPDSGLLLYASQEEPAGLYLFDLSTHTEYRASPSVGLPVVFAHWGKDGTIYYGVKKADTSIMCYTTNVKEIEGGK